MKFLHTADLHVGKTGSVPAPLERQRKMLDGIIDVAVDEEVSAVFVCGDVFEHGAITHQEKDVVWLWLVKLDRVAVERKFKVVIIPGNHDQLQHGYTHLHPFAALSDAGNFRNITIVDGAPRLLRLSRRLFVAACPPSATPDSKAIARVVRQMRGEADAVIQAEELDPSYFVTLLHVGAFGASVDSGKINTDGVRLDGGVATDLWLLGDYHKHQKIAGVERAWYCGSPIQHDWGDVGRRGVLIHNTINLEQPRLVELPGIIKMTTVTMEKLEAGEIPTDELVRLQAPVRDLADAKLPANVVATKPLIDEAQVLADLHIEDELEGLAELLAARGLGVEEQERALALIAAVRPR